MSNQPVIETSTRYIGWCPVCQRDIKVRSNLLVHHGYLRPGTGSIIGDCYGVEMPPHEISPQTAEGYLRYVIWPEVHGLRAGLRVLTSPEGPAWLLFEDYDAETGRVKRDQHRDIVMVQLSREEALRRAETLPSYYRDWYDWEKRLRIVTANVESNLRMWEKEQKRLEGLIETWEPKPLRTVEEEIQRQEETKAEREHARTVARDAKISAEVVKIRKRIDSAVRNKNSATLADIWTSNKLEQVSGYRLTRDQGRALLERDTIWRAFGLLNPDGSELEDTRSILQQMWYGTWVRRADGGRDTLPFRWPDELGGGFAKTRR